jgi:hypothetical protein
MTIVHNHASGADGMKIAGLRKGLASLKFIRAAAHQQRWPWQYDYSMATIC